MNDMARNMLLWVIIAVVLMTVFNNFGNRPTTASRLAYSDFISQVNDGQVARVVRSSPPSPRTTTA